MGDQASALDCVASDAPKRVDRIPGTIDFFLLTRRDILPGDLGSQPAFGGRRRMVQGAESRSVGKANV